MSGAILGVVNFNKATIKEEVGQAMLNRLNIYKLDRVSHLNKDNVFMGCGLLHITEESLTEVLPFYDEKSGLMITADAIIDNRKELFNEFNIDENKAISDSELILKTYKKWGRDCPKHLIGDFAFAIWDERKEELFCARDHVGTRTFYYYKDENKCIFSTVRETIANVLGNKTFNKQWIAEFLALDKVIHQLDAEKTIYSNIYNLPTAHYMIVNKEDFVKKQYWNPVKEVKELKLNTDEEYNELFKKTFFEAVNCRLRCISDVGVMLSGGLDSGSVAVVASKLLSKNNKRLKGYSSIPIDEFKECNIKGRIGNEKKYVDSISRYSKNIDIKYLKCEDKSSITDIDNLVNVLEQPYKIIENLFWYDEILKNASSENCKVVLNGQYGNYTISYGDFTTHLITLYKKKRFRMLFKELNSFSRNNKIPKLNMYKGFYSIIYGQKSKETNDINNIINKYLNKDILNKLEFEEKLNKNSFLNNQYIDLEETKKYRFDLIAFSQISEVETKLGLKEGLIKRDPTRDKRIVEFCLSMPTEQLVRDGQDRYLIRRAMNEILPDEVRLNSSERGLQGADWLDRLKPIWLDICNELEKELNNEHMQQYLDIKQIRDDLKVLKYEIEDKNKREIRSLVVTLIFIKFIKQFQYSFHLENV